MYGLLGICLALSAMLAVNAIASVSVAALWRTLSQPALGWSATTRARLIFTLRVFPATGAFLCVAFFFIPSYLSYEPWPTGEVVSLKLAVFALVSVIGIALAIWRGLASLIATRRLVANWMRYAEAMTIEGVSVPAYRVEHPFPVIAVVGMIKPRLFVASRVLDALSSDEISAAVAHEAGHLSARDNLKRGLMRACRDVLTIVPCGRSLDRAWSESAEAAADEYAAQAGGDVALDLASALVKIARLVPAGMKPTMPAGAFLVEETTGGGIAWRVRRLTQLAEGRAAYSGNTTLWASAATRICFCAGLMALVCTAANPRVLASLHDAMEYIVSALN